MQNTLKHLFISFLYLPALGLTGCSGYTKAGLGFLQRGHENTSELRGAKLCIEKSQPQLQHNRSKTEIAVDTAGGIGGLAMGFAGGIVGGGTGALGGGVYAACKGVAIDQGIKNGAATGAYYGFYIGAPIGAYTFRGVARGLIWVTPYVIGSARWAACNSYNGIKYATSSIYNRVTGFNKSLVDSHLDQDLGLEMINDDNDKKSIELKAFSKEAKCPLGCVISG